MFRVISSLLFVATLHSTSLQAQASSPYTTQGPNIVDRRTGEAVILKGFGLGCWLLPEGYMWGIRKLDRPRQFEAAIVDLIGAEDAVEFWRLYRDNFVTEGDIAAMKSWGANSVRVALLASMLQSREGQPDAPPYHYSDEAFKYLDRLVEWCERHDIGVIWDMHGAPGAQNAENISDSDGEARLWTQKEIYWPRCIDLWLTIARRYAQHNCIIGYDLLNEPLLRRYPGINPALLREFYVECSRKIREIDAEGLLFIEGDDWAQEFSMLEPLDWDKHLVVTFHSYPPTANQDGLERWDRLRRKYDVPLWHGETGEVGPPYAVNRISTEFLEQANVGWNWWTHKKFERMSQPWDCPKTSEFQKIIDYWKGETTRPGRDEARAALFEQARLTHSDRCVLIPEMVRSLHGLDPSRQPAGAVPVEPRIVRALVGATVEEGGVAEFFGLVSGRPLIYSWLRNGEVIDGESSYRLRLGSVSLADDGAKLALRAANDLGAATSPEVILTVRPFSGPLIRRAALAPVIDGQVDEEWNDARAIPVDHVVFDRGKRDTRPAVAYRALWTESCLYLLVEVDDDVLCSEAATSFENDGVEIYIDFENRKADFYTDGDRRLRFVWNSAEVRTIDGKPATSVRAAQVKTGGGYRMEFGIAGSSGEEPLRAGQFIGLDVQANDNDGHGRVQKRAWHAQRDDAHLSPAQLGTVRLVDQPSNAAGP